MKKLIGVNSTILLVDDEREILELTRDSIQDHFSEVILAENGEDACEILKAKEIDLIVTDYVMPKMDGLELITFVKDNYPLIPVIMLTANGNNPEILHALKNGAFDIIDKPFKPQVLINRIQNGLLVPELMKIVWSLMSEEFELLKLEEFLKNPPKDQHKVIYAFASILKMKSILKKDSDDLEEI